MKNNRCVVGYAVHNTCAPRLHCASAHRRPAAPIGSRRCSLIVCHALDTAVGALLMLFAAVAHVLAAHASADAVGMRTAHACPDHRLVAALIDWHGAADNPNFVC